MLRDLIGLHVDEAVDVRVTLNPHAPAPKATALDYLPHPPTPNSEPPAWIAAERWAELPVMLRAALVGSQLVDGEVRGRSRL